MAQKPPSLRDELRQSKPFESPAQEAILALSRTNDRLQRRFAELIEPHGISRQQYNVLRILRGAGSDGTPTLEIADRMVEKTPGITRLLDRLEAKHLVRRRRCPKDRRQVLCWITNLGLKLLADMDRPVSETAPRLLKSLSDSEVESLIDMLARIRRELVEPGAS
jgi:MarR family transcriptional regulator, organic hydroperoxide resistance regulator